MKDIYNLKVHYLYYHTKFWEMTIPMQSFSQQCLAPGQSACLKEGIQRGQRLGEANRQEADGEGVAT